ncbi:serine/threonine-protein kinase [Catellatospora tritici]|uniref:serine/threonine-protein kinase n=1 Tax=Catellatospora tritici TaxID=2851566 RepID=UPI001C2D9625|nr:serine/threonine-protein kinase [Catellatospora tritici]MBV1854325.1 protein kinase [Catellatospora tritici]
MNTHVGAGAGGGLRLDERYRLIKQVGSGGMSVVWDAHDEVLQRQVAVKLLAPGMAADPPLPRRLLMEARAVAALRHPNITSVYDFGVHRADGGVLTPYLVMEMLDGELLSHVLRLGRLSWREAVSVCAQLAAALTAAHAAGIAHRDVNPANIMLTPTGVKVLDFGICALIGDEQHCGDDIVGTVPYLAPERLTRGQVTADADVYAAGLVLYRCLCGRLPWEAGTVTEALYAHAHVQPRRLPPLDLPRAIEDVCYRCLAHEPHRRPSAAELAQILSGEVQRIAVATPRRDEAPARSPGGHGETMTIALDNDLQRLNLPPRRILVGAAALCAVLTLGYLGYPPGSPTATAQADTANHVPCSIVYSADYTNDRQFAAAVTVTNTAQDPLDQWTLQFWLPDGETVAGTPPTRTDTRQVTDAATTHVGQQGRQVTVTNLPTLPSGLPAVLALTGRHAGIPDQPATGFTLNARRCDATITIRTAAPQPPAPATVARPTTPGESPPRPHKPEKPHGKHPRDGTDKSK